MRILRSLSPRAEWLGYGAALGLTGAVTGVIALMRLVADVPNVSMLYLLAVLASAVLFGSGPAILSAMAAFLAFNFFFIHPEFTFTVADEDQWVALGLLLVTGIVTGQLAAALRDRADQARTREREAVVLYDVVRLMSEPDLVRALQAVAERIRSELEVSAVLITLRKGGEAAVQAEAGEADARATARSTAATADNILAPGSVPSGAGAGSPGRWVRVVLPTSRAGREHRTDRVHRVPVSFAGQTAGSIIVVSAAGTRGFRRVGDRLLSAVASQLGIAMERMLLRDEATEAEILRRTDELRAALLNAVSHDLRTPLSSIIASAGSLLQEDVQWSYRDRREFAEAIEREAQRLNRLVGNLLDLSRIEAGSMRPDKSWYDLRSLVDEAVGRLSGMTEANLRVDVPDDLPPVNFDYVEIDQVITNLIENAEKHTPRGTQIAVSARSAGDKILVEVADRGPGIPAEAMPHLFDPFYRGTRANETMGAGLGLAVAKGLIEGHGGRIWAENVPEGGARFMFTLPLEAAVAAPAREEQV